jgi:tetrahydromethanopterin S-methyltransferase subunit F
VALTRAAQAEKNAAEVVKRAQAAQAQAKVEDPEYVARVAAREAKRASGNA